MAKFWTCKYGANHGMGERCDCEQEFEMEREMARRAVEQTEKYLIREVETGQLAFMLDGKEVHLESKRGC